MSVQGGTTPLNSLLRKGKEEMIATKDLERIIQLALYSAYVKDERPVSILISSRVESGKTEILRKSSHLDGILYIADATAYGIQKEYLDQIATGKIRTIVIPDLITPLSRSSDTVETFIAFLNGLIEEGIVEIQTYATSIKLTVPARCNIITSIAKEHLFDQRHRWTKVGFLSRVVPVSYSYGASTIYDIMDSIANKGYHSEQPFSLNFPEESIDIKLPVEIANRIMALVPNVIDRENFAEKLYGFRLQKQLQTLCMASALQRGKETVTEEDFNKVKRLSDFFNLSFRQI